MEVKSFLGQKLRTLRGSKSQSEISSVFGEKQTTYSAWENGKTSPSITILYAISKHYNVSTDWLLGLTEKQPLQSESTKSCPECQKKDEIIINLSQTLKNVTTSKKEPTTKPITPSSTQTAKRD